MVRKINIGRWPHMSMCGLPGRCRNVRLLLQLNRVSDGVAVVD